MSISIRNHDRTRLANAMALHPTDALLDPALDLIDDIRHETIEKCRNDVVDALVRVANGAMTHERLRRLLDERAAESSGASGGSDG